MKNGITPAMTIKQRLFEFMLDEFPDTMEYTTYSPNMEIIIHDGVLKFFIPLSPEYIQSVCEHVVSELSANFGIEIYPDAKYLNTIYGSFEMWGDLIRLEARVGDNPKIEYLSVDKMYNKRKVRNLIKKAIADAKDKLRP